MKKRMDKKAINRKWQLLMILLVVAMLSLPSLGETPEEERARLESELSNLTLQLSSIDDGIWVNYSMDVSYVKIYNYSCVSTAFERSKVLTSGKHDLQFSFANLTAEAHNAASGSHTFTLHIEDPNNLEIYTGDTQTINPTGGTEVDNVDEDSDSTIIDCTEQSVAGVYEAWITCDDCSDPINSDDAFHVGDNTHSAVGKTAVIECCYQNSDCEAGEFCSQDNICVADLADGEACGDAVTYVNTNDENHGACTSGYCDVYDENGAADEETCFSVSSSYLSNQDSLCEDAIDDADSTSNIADNCDDYAGFSYLSGSGWCYGTDGCTSFCSSEVVDEDNDGVFSTDSGESCGCDATDDSTPLKCDSDFDQSVDGLCVEVSGTYECDDDASEICYDGATYRSDCTYCGKTAADDDTCDADGGTSYSASGICVEAGADDACDADGGVCSDDGTSGTLYADCSDANCGKTAANNDACDSNGGTTYSPDGMCVFSDAGHSATACDVAGEVCSDGTNLHDDCDLCASEQQCDSNGGTSFSADGMCGEADSDNTNDDCLTGAVCRDSEDSNHLNEGCECNSDGTDWDAYDSNGGTSFSADGICAGTSADTAGEACYDGSNYQTDCSSCNSGDSCDTDITDGAYSADGVCVGSNCVQACACPASGDWIGSFADNCIITEDCDMQGNDVIITGSGTWNVYAKIYNFNKFEAHTGTFLCWDSGGCLE